MKQHILIISAILLVAYGFSGVTYSRDCDRCAWQLLTGGGNIPIAYILGFMLAFVWAVLQFSKRGKP